MIHLGGGTDLGDGQSTKSVPFFCLELIIMKQRVLRKEQISILGFFVGKHRNVT